MEKIRIAFLCAGCYSLFNQSVNKGFGGAEVDLYNFARFLAMDERFEVYFYVGDFDQTAESEIYDNIIVEKIKLFGRTGKSISEKIVFYSALGMKLLKSPAKIIMTEMANEMTGWAAIYFKLLTKRGYIHRLASDNDTKFTDARSSGRALTYHLYNFALKKADVIYSQSADQQILLKENMGFESSILPNGVFIDEKPGTSDKKYILWVGRAIEVKQPELFIELAKQIPDEDFFMIMPFEGQHTSESFRKNLNEKLNEAKKLSNFRYADYVPFDKIQSYFDEAKLFINTSEYEGFPNTFIQACIGGTPIASLNVDPDSFIERNKVGRYCESDMKNLKEFIQDLDKEDIDYYGDNAYRYALENHDIFKIAEGYKQSVIGLYEKLTG